MDNLIRDMANTTFSGNSTKISGKKTIGGWQIRSQIIRAQPGMHGHQLPQSRVS